MTTTTQQSLEEKYKEIVSQTNWETVLCNLSLEPKNCGDYLEILCPKCNERRAFFYPNTDTGKPKITCNRKNECGFESHILELLNNGAFPRGEDWKESVKKLANLAGIPFELNSNFTPRSYPNQKDILLDYWQFLQNRFPGSPAEKYVIENRKLDPSVTSFGYFPSKVEEVYEWAKGKGYSEEELLSSFIIKEKNGSKFPAMYGRLAGAFIDQRGNVHNIWGRDLTGKIEGSKKYFNLDNSDIAHKKSPYGAEQFKSGIVVWVEGYLDVVAAKESGIVAVASGTASIPEDMVKSLSGLHTIVIALDKDGAGGKGAFAFIERNVNNENMKIFAINHELMKGCKDIAELYEKYGKEAVKNVFLPDNLEHAFTFAAEHILSKHKTGETWTPITKENALSEATLFDKKVVSSSKIPLLKDYFWCSGIQKALELDDCSLDNHIDNLKQKKEKERLKNQIDTYSLSANKKAAEGDLEGAANDLSRVNQLCVSYNSDAKDLAIKFISGFGKEWLEKEPPPKEMLLSFDNENNIAQGFLPRGVVGMLAGPGGVGKSHLMTQMAKSTASGTSLFGKYYPKRAGAVFLGMGENSIEDLRRIIWKASVGLSSEEKNNIINNLAPHSFHGQNAAFLDGGKPSGYFYKLKEELIKNSPNEGWDLLIFDPASRLLGVDAEKDNALATLFISLLEQLIEDVPGNPTVLFAHHVNKSAINQRENQNQSAARGASGLTDGCRWQVNFFKDEGDNKNSYSLKMVKTNFTKVIDPISLEKDENGILKYIRRGYVT